MGGGGGGGGCIRDYWVGSIGDEGTTTIEVIDEASFEKVGRHGVEEVLLGD